MKKSKEEIFNTVTHGVGFVLSLILIPVLLFKINSKDLLILLSFYLFSIGFLSTYLSSTLYHLAGHEKLKRKLRVWDHISIYILIGGTYSPVVFVYLDRTDAITFMSIMWGLILVSIILKLFYTGRFSLLSTILYLGIGWMAIFIFKPLYNNMSITVFWWILSGGVSYTLGVIFYRWHKLPYHHGVWHLFVLGGTVCHYIALYKLI